MEDSAKPKQETSRVRILQPGEQLDWEPPLFMTKAASSEDFATKCSDIMALIRSLQQKSRESSPE